MNWSDRASEAHDVLLRRYRNGSPFTGWPGLFRLADPPTRADRWTLGYWWQAQALDALVDAQLRDPSGAGLRRIRSFVYGLRIARRWRWINDYYDDVAWMALALLRADEVGAGTAPIARRLLRHLVGGWSDAHGGGVCWSRMQPDYKNVPANGPIAILAARVYQRFRDPEDLRWAQRIVDWMDGTLVDHRTNLVWDGIGRNGDDRIDRDWKFTYTHGVVIGAHAELAGITGEARHAERADATVDAVLAHLVPDGILQDEGDGDGAMFRGILARYLTPRENPRANEILLRSATAAWESRDAVGRFTPIWHTEPAAPAKAATTSVHHTPDGTSPTGVTLAAHLSGLFLCEQMATLERANRLPAVGS